MERRNSTVSMRGAQFVDPSALARIRNLELLARTVVDGFINGLHRAPHLGFSLDFAEHRAYEPGDDLRRVDWRVFARTDRYYVKQFEVPDPREGGRVHEPGAPHRGPRVPAFHRYIPDFGAGTEATSRSMIWSVVTPSDSAWKFVRTRWRITGWASALTSSSATW